MIVLTGPIVNHNFQNVNKVAIVCNLQVTNMSTLITVQCMKPPDKSWKFSSLLGCCCLWFVISPILGHLGVRNNFIIKLSHGKTTIYILSRIELGACSNFTLPFTLCHYVKLVFLPATNALPDVGAGVWERQRTTLLFMTW